MLNTLFALTNIINTSSSYDQTIKAPFRFEKITASYDENTISVILDYYINTNEPTEISLSVNGHNKHEVLSLQRSKKSMRKIKLSLPNDGENNTLRINFSAIFAQSYNMDGSFYFDNGTKESHDLDENGQYKYKIIKEIMFINKTQTFLYKYNYININVLPNKNNTYNTYSKIVESDNLNTKLLVNLKRNNEIVFQGTADKEISNKLNLPGNYNSQILLKYRVGGVYKSVNLNYDWNIEKNYKGDCKNSYICLLNDKITGTLEEIISTNLIL